MDANHICSVCGKPVVADARQGLCPECLLKSGFETKIGESPTAGKLAFVPPSVEELSRLFPLFEIIEFLGHDGRGAVYKARQPQLNRFVALKLLSAEKQNDPHFASRFERVARALAWLNHPGIVTVYDFGETQGHFYLLMEFVDGQTLRQLLQTRRLAPTETLAMVSQICEALQFAHEQGAVHRNLKPENILLDKNGRVKIADFGIAKILDLNPRDRLLTGTREVLDTLHYLAPEQLEKPQTVDCRADIYSLGVVFYEMLTGGLPLGNFPPPSQKVMVDVRLDEVVLRALQKEPSLRYQKARQLLEDLQNFTATQLPDESAHPASEPPPTAGASGRDIPPGDYTLHLSHCLGRGWALVGKNFWPAVCVIGPLLLLQSLFSYMFVGKLVSAPLLGGLCLYFLKKMRGETAGVGTAFAGFSRAFLPLFLASLLTAVLTGVGFICLILPGIYLTVAWSFAPVLIIDRGLGSWEAMDLSRRTVGRHWWKSLGLMIILWLLKLAGTLFFAVGILVTAPVALAALMYAYEDMFGGPRAAAAPASVAASAPPVVASRWSTGRKIAVGAASLLIILLLLVAGTVMVLRDRIASFGVQWPHLKMSGTTGTTQGQSTTSEPATNTFNLQVADNQLNEDQAMVLEYINRKYTKLEETRNFASFTDDQRAALEGKLLETLKGPRNPAYYRAIISLGALHDTDALPVLRQMAYYRGEKILRIEISNRPRILAIRALSVMNDKTDVPKLIHLLYHNNGFVRWSAQIALVQMTGQNFGGDWQAWGKWWNDQNGDPPYDPTVIKWWRGQAESDQLVTDVAADDQKFLAQAKGKK